MISADLGRARCATESAAALEWLVTNGRGGYAMGTVTGELTRSYHGWLVAASDPPAGRTLRVAKAEAVVTQGDRTWQLGTNRWASGAVQPDGWRHLERFRIEDGLPVWTWRFGANVLERRLWMVPGEDTTCVRYTLRAGAPITLSLKVLVNARPHHGGATPDATVVPLEDGLQISHDGAEPLFVRSRHGRWVPAHDRHAGYRFAMEAARGLPAVGDHLAAGALEVELEAGGNSVIVLLSTRPDAAPRLPADPLRGAQALLDGETLPADRAVATALAHAAAQFVVERPQPFGVGASIIAGYPWFADWGRDTFIALPGLALSTGRLDLAAELLRTWSTWLQAGLLPNRFPDGDGAPEYNTADATLWFVHALGETLAAGADPALGEDLRPTVEAIVDAHRDGTLHGIGADDDGLLRAGAGGLQLTWMDARLGDWVVTPRRGKPVEINALWIHALAVADRLGVPCAGLLARARGAFSHRFWDPSRGHLRDVVDGPDGDDPALRPNQLIAAALPSVPLSTAQRAAIVEVCATRLLTSHGLRTLDPDAPGYQPRYHGPPAARDGAYHQGTVWPWLLGPFVDAHLLAHGDRRRARAYLRPLTRHLAEAGCLGSISEVFDAEPPHAPGGCPAQAWSVACLLRAWQRTAPHDPKEPVP